MRTQLNRTRTAVLAVSAALALGLSACGSNDPSTVTGSPGGSAATERVSAEHNDADVAFINDMTPHHSGALAMAELAPTRASSDEVKDLAADIAAEQGPELKRMQEMATAWGVELKSGGMEMGGGMAMGGDAATLEPLKGAEFDKTFLELMTAHHESALTMSQAQLDDGQNRQASALAEAIIKSQTKEIAEMKKLLEAL